MGRGENFMGPYGLITVFQKAFPKKAKIDDLQHCFSNTGSGPICGPQRHFYGSPIYFPNFFCFLFSISDNFKRFSKKRFQKRLTFSSVSTKLNDFSKSFLE